jgi:predicted dehydrogenase
MPKDELTRREFVESVGKGAVAAGALLTVGPWLSARAQGPASDRLRLGMIGFGVRGRQLFPGISRVPGTEVVAVADLYDGHLQRARELGGDKLETTREYRRLLDRKDIDAVVVATPDHWHVPIMLEAASAGKDIYAEKPLTHDWEDGAKLLAKLKETGCVVQVGSGRVSMPLYQKAREIVQSGQLGKVTFVTAWWDSRSSIYAWRTPIPPDASPQTIDWERFLGPAPARPFDPKRFFRWRCFWDYGEGLAGDLFSHLLTAIHWMLDISIPQSAVAQGGIYLWKDGRDVPDTFNALYDYPEGLAVSLSATKTNSSRDQEIQILGTEAALTISNGELVVQKETHEEAYTYVGESLPKEQRELFYVVHGLDRNGQPREPATPEETVERYTPPSRRFFGGGGGHMQNFVNAVRGREQPRETAEMGNNAALAVHMANLAFRHGIKVVWDDAQQRPVW